MTITVCAGPARAALTAAAAIANVRGDGGGGTGKVHGGLFLRVADEDDAGGAEEGAGDDIHH